MAVQEQIRQVGDTRIALAATLTRPGGAVVPLAGLTLKFTMVTSQGTVKIAETIVGVSVTDAAAGEVQYTFLAAGVDTAGTFHAYFIAETAGGAQDTFPAVTGELIVTIEPLVR